MRNGRAYTSGQVNHFDVCHSFEVFSPAGEPDHSAAHAGWEIILPAVERPSAGSTMKIRGRAHRITPGNFLLFNAHEDHVESYSAAETGRVRAIVFPESFVSEVFPEVGMRPGEVLFDRADQPLDRHLGELMERIFALRGGASESRLAFECQAVSLLLALAERCSSSLTPRLRRLSGRGRFPANVARAQKIIGENIARDDFSLDELAARAGISKFHLIRAFKARLGVSPMRYIRLVRLELAKSFLAQGHSVSRASELAGFADFSTVNKAFKRHMGHPPVAFRRSR